MTVDSTESTILLIDDDPTNLDIVTDYLLDCDYTILVAEDGESGISRAEYAQPGLILLDVMMPGIDGFETCRRLKTRESTRDIPVIFMTALAETEHKVKGFEAGAVDYITKPFQREEVLARVSVHLRIRELTARLQEAKESLEKRVEERTAELAQTIDTLHDEIIQRKQAEEERVRLARAIEQAAEAVYMADAQGLITYVNPAFERTTGYSRDEVIGQPTGILECDTNDPDYYLQIREAVDRDNDWSGRVTTRKKDGSVFEADTTVSSVRDSKGTIINYVSILRDVTHELKLERELRQSQKMEAIGTLAGGIAHDFNNILTAVIGYTDMALSKLPNDSTALRDLERVQEASTRAKDLVGRILTFSRQSEQKRKPVQLATIIDEVFKLLRSTLPSTIEINQQVHTPVSGDTVLADPTQLHQVLMNLGTNAAHAMRPHGGVLSVSLTDIEADAPLISFHPDIRQGPYLRLTVSDTGHGMEESVRERIFDPYFTTKKVGEGTGMGLAVVQGIVKSHGGAISVYSEPGLGTTFHIFLPKFRGDAVSPEASKTSEARGTERILFVDDEAMLADLGQELLESLGYSVTVTLSSREALELFRAAPKNFDLVITDMTMPGLTGKELAREFLGIRPEIPIILCTGFSEQINEKLAKEAGIKGYILKPYARNSLNDSIRKALSGD
ncbi:blue-light-activated protein [Geobacter sp. OR-1]|uniref:response regulator n=1 Tax=Geobacter sp. OR-1 TaxID=1266765 RepID=UPI00054257F9|nr:response regulator [Geobacter sp. OR-1]GAM09085.1 blue-light-activated protein [Geobacter sp. OR-1]